MTSSITGTSSMIISQNVELVDVSMLPNRLSKSSSRASDSEYVVTTSAQENMHIFKLSLILINLMILLKKISRMHLVHKGTSNVIIEDES